MKAPLAIELFAGTFGWSQGWLAAGGRAIGFDIEHLPHHGEVPANAELVLQDVLTLDGAQFKDAAVIFASPPCQKYSYLAMPWSKSTDPNNSKAAKALRKEWETNGPDNRLFDACFRIQREAIAATQKTCTLCAGSGIEPNEDDEECYTCDRCGGLGWTERRHIPLIVENVRGAQPWVGRSKANLNSFHLWGDVRQIGNRIQFGADIGRFGAGYRVTAEDGTKIGGDWFSDPKSTCRKHGSRSAARKAASALIARIPADLSEYAAQALWPAAVERAAPNSTLHSILGILSANGQHLHIDRRDSADPALPALAGRLSGSGCPAGTG